MKVLLRGDSAATWCCGHLLRRAGFNPSLEAADRPRLPAILLGEAAQSLIRDVFNQPTLFRDAPRITKRVVQWGPKVEKLAVEHSAVVVSERELLAELRQDLEQNDGIANFTIFSSQPLPGPPVELTFGSRIASAARVRLRENADADACWIESLEEGWVFLIPAPGGDAWLLSVGGSTEGSLQQSTLIAPMVDSICAEAGRFSASPRILSPLAGPVWLVCGSAGLAFDPLCGDGTAHAVREAILASAVVRGIERGGDAPSLLAHYQARLTLGFARHLEACQAFYRSGHSGPWWDRELESLQNGIEWCARKLAAHGAFRYQLQGFDLTPISG